MATAAVAVGSVVSAPLVSPRPTAPRVPVHRRWNVRHAQRVGQSGGNGNSSNDYDDDYDDDDDQDIAGDNRSTSGRGGLHSARSSDSLDSNSDSDSDSDSLDSDSDNSRGDDADTGNLLGIAQREVRTAAYEHGMVMFDDEKRNGDQTKSILDLKRHDPRIGEVMQREFIPLDVAKRKIDELVDDMRAMKARHLKVIDEIEKGFSVVSAADRREFAKLVEQMKSKARGRLRQQRKKIASLVNDLDMLRQQYREQGSDLAKQRELLVNVERCNVDLRRGNSDMTQQIGDLRDKIREFGEIAKAKEDVERARDVVQVQLDDARAEIERLGKEKNEQHEAVEAAALQHQHALEPVAKETRQRASAEHRESISALSGEHDVRLHELQERVQHLEALDREKSERIDRLQEEKQSILTDSFSSFLVSLAGRVVLRSDGESRQKRVAAADLKRLRSEREQALERNRDLMEQVAQLPPLRVRIEALDAEKSGLVDERDRVQARYDQMLSEQAQGADEALQAQLEALGAELIELRTERDSLRTKFNHAEAGSATKSGELGRVSGDLQRVIQERDSVTRQRDESHALVDDLKRQLSQNQNTIDSLNAQLASLSSLQGNSHAQDAKISHLNDRIAELESERTILRRFKDSAEQNIVSDERHGREHPSGSSPVSADVVMGADKPCPSASADAGTTVDVAFDGSASPAQLEALQELHDLREQVHRLEHSNKKMKLWIKRKKQQQEGQSPGQEDPSDVSRGSGDDGDVVSAADPLSNVPYTGGHSKEKKENEDAVHGESRHSAHELKVRLKKMHAAALKFKTENAKLRVELEEKGRQLQIAQQEKIAEHQEHMGHSDATTAQRAVPSTDPDVDSVDRPHIESELKSLEQDIVQQEEVVRLASQGHSRASAAYKGKMRALKTVLSARGLIGKGKKSKMKDLDDDTKAMYKEVRKLKKQAQAKDAELVKQRTSLDELRRKADDLRAVFDVAHVDSPGTVDTSVGIERLRAQLREATERHELELNTKEAELKHLRDQIVAQSTVVTASAAMPIVGTDGGKDEPDVHSAPHALASELNRSLQAVKLERKQAMDRSRELERSLSTKEHELRQAQHESKGTVEQLQRKESELQRVQTDLSAAQHELKELREKQEKQEKHEKQDPAAADDSRVPREDMEKLEHELVHVRERKDELEKKLRVAIDKLKSFKAAYEKKKGEIQKLRDEVKAANDARIGESDAKLGELRATIEKNEKRIGDLEQEKQQLAAQHAASSSAAEKQLVARFEAEKKAVEDKLRRDLENLKNTSQAQIEQTHARATEAEAKAADAQKELAVTSNSLSTLQSDHESLKQAYSGAEAQLAQLKVKAADGVQAARQVEYLSAQVEQYKKDMRVASQSLVEEQARRKKANNQVQNLLGKIRVYCRVRPMAKREVDQGSLECVRFPDKYTILLKKEEVNKEGQRGFVEKEYEFDEVFAPGLDGSQEGVFKATRDLVQSAMDGYNVCVFAYGQTGSGKTYTIAGASDGSSPGLKPRMVAEVFQIAERTRKTFDYEISAYMIEIYLDRLRDLFWQYEHRKRSDKSEAPGLTPIMDKTKKIVTIRNCTLKRFMDAKSLMEDLGRAETMRKVGSTNMNAESSRSHLVFGMLLKRTDRKSGKVYFGKLSLVDLAGSESVGKTGAKLVRLEEAKSINRSLSALSQVFKQLASPKGIKPSYRSNMLTLVMQDSLGGNAKTLMFVNVSPSDSEFQESISSLRYARLVKMIKNNATVDMETKEIARLKEIIKKLKRGQAVESEFEVLEIDPNTGNDNNDEEQKEE